MEEKLTHIFNSRHVTPEWPQITCYLLHLETTQHIHKVQTQSSLIQLSWQPQFLGTIALCILPSIITSSKTPISNK